MFAFECLQCLGRIGSVGVSGNLDLNLHVGLYMKICFKGSTLCPLLLLFELIAWFICQFVGHIYDYILGFAGAAPNCNNTIC